jgi:predicted DNA-binding transcriptional regulator YafY
MKTRVTARPDKVERAIRILAYLKKNTDAQHTVSQEELRSSDMREYVGNKETYHNTIMELANVLNSSEDGYKEEKDWQIIFDDFRKYFGKNSDDIELEEDTVMRIKGLYYQHPFSYDDIDRLLEGVYSSKTIGVKEADALAEKIKENLTTKYYENQYKNLCKIHEPQLADRETLKNNLLVLQKAIQKNIQVAFHFNGYSKDKKMIPTDQRKTMVSPYYIVANSGKYYLLACLSSQKAHRLWIWRIDLLSEVEIATDAEHKKGFSAVPKDQVANLPQQWNEEFQLKHLNMAYDKPVKVTLKIRGIPGKENSPIDYTFLHDWFGDQFVYLRSEENPYPCDVVSLECSPYAMASWALQYSSRVEVLSPKSLRDDIKQKILHLNSIYQ